MKPVTLPPGRARLATKPPAYRAVYPSIKSDDVAGAAAARLLGNVRIRARIAEIMRVGVSWRNELVTRTEKRRAREGLDAAVTIVDADKISDEAAAAVAEVSQTVNGALRVKLHDKHAALVSIGRYLGMFDDRVKVDAVYGISEEPMSAEE